MGIVFFGVVKSNSLRCKNTFYSVYNNRTSYIEAHSTTVTITIAWAIYIRSNIPSLIVIIKHNINTVKHFISYGKYK